MPNPDDLWNRRYSQEDSPVDGWQQDSILANNNARLRNVEAKLDAQGVVIRTMAETISKLVTTPGSVTTDELLALIDQRLESAKLDVPDSPKE